MDSKFIVGGDFNSKHTTYGSRLTTPKGRQLVSLAEQKGYSFLSTGSPTYWPTDPKKIPDLLDLFVTNGISSTNMDVKSSFDLSSDHSAIIATFSSFIIHRKHTTRQHNRKTDWDKYRTKIEDDLPRGISLKTQKDIEEALSTFNNVITKAVEETTPTIAQPNKIYHIPTGIKELIAHKRRARAI